MRRYIGYMAVALALLSFQSCELDFEPQDELSPEIVQNDIAKVESLMLTAYTRGAGFGMYAQQAMLTGDVLADNANLRARTGRYEGEWINAFFSHYGRWGLYSGINECNLALKYVNSAQPSTTSSIETAEELQALRDQLRGEAYFLRAFYYHDLVKVYGYEPGREVNGWDEGVILRTQAAETLSDAEDPAFNTRVTNTEIYARINADLDSAIALLPFTPPSNSFGGNGVGNVRAHVAAAKALKARVLLYEGEYAAAAAMSQSAQADVANNGLAEFIGDEADDPTILESWTATPYHPESIFSFSIGADNWGAADEGNNSLISLTTNIEPESYQYILVASPELVALITDDDTRSALYEPVTDQGSDNFTCLKWAGSLAQEGTEIPVIRYPELLLIEAEALARLGGNDAAARAALNELRTARGLTASSFSGPTLIRQIMEERRREFAFEGHRWFDLKRNGEDIPKSEAGQAAGAPLSLSYDDPRILAPIPQSQIDLKDGLEQNPGY